MRLSTKEKFRLSILATLRWTMAITFLIYGMAKIYPGQFITGDFVFDSTKDSAMKLAWYFFGYSDFYNYFIANITVLNYCFNIPAKVVCVPLLAMSLLLVLMEYSKLKGIFFVNAATQMQKVDVQSSERKVTVK
ncbi:hypothetical protein H8R29_12605 [Priestia megaterium]|uniref:Uncharacterized protein n=1 Tax=Priestia megaterium (strain ATCC 14581 / DSM 32 / CCUG 1817 / JCM 2506 / NBRC 15308 / NCIMB 9376 / NCTC 10342 / NRRL B-14308 / VKM B-512 / Ford 19) TaxID=1348623 RepID=A0A0B6AKL8_PRIM2|nr:hypothetical protein [Priestia megaterium]AJI20344.1 hypothetical protein BG04_4812 [Priestia megaterium NBRC 15308 = ATCC 14581]KFM97237.1 hypothetical protein DJ91_457 [Priestia megaterium]KGJ74088.1 hypothetical protein BMT_06845 [Priestia megaterium NBRC 15308 = ATCC 14581]MDR4231554.1 hypothetical protein [Priestia megaterium]MED3807826.1 hypothetical protein [Priestia megaterium]